MTTTPRIAIVGAGPGGLLCARVLQRHGIPVTVFDRDAYAEDRPQGGALANLGTLTVSGGAFNSNEVFGAPVSNGGAIYNAGTLTVQGAAFSSNVAYGNGGDIFSSGTASITGSSFTGNAATIRNRGAPCSAVCGARTPCSRPTEADVRADP